MKTQDEKGKRIKVTRKRNEIPAEGRRLSVTFTKEELKSIQKLAIDLETNEKGIVKTAIDYLLLAKKQLVLTRQSEEISLELLTGLLGVAAPTSAI